MKFNELKVNLIYIILYLKKITKLYGKKIEKTFSIFYYLLESLTQMTQY